MRPSQRGLFAQTTHKALCPFVGIEGFGYLHITAVKSVKNFTIITDAENSFFLVKIV